MGAENLDSRAIKGLMEVSLIQNATTPSWVQAISGNVIASDQTQETYRWLSDTPALRQWVGGRQQKELVDYAVTIINDTYESSLDIKLQEMRKDKIGQIQMRIDDLSRRMATHWGKLATDLLVGNGTAYDGKSFFATDHTEEDSGTQDNALTVTATTPSDPDAAEMKTAILNSVEALVGYLDGAQEPVAEDASAFLVLIPPSMLGSATAALENQIIVESGAAATNTVASLQGMGFQLAWNPRLTGASMYVFRTDSGLPSVIRQEVNNGAAITAKAEGSDYEHDYLEHSYGVHVERAVGFGRWQNAVRTTFTV